MADQAKVEWEKLRVPCPRCGRDTVVRQNKENGHRFFGCVGWPVDCQHVAEISQSVLMRLQGAPTLPGF